jgi:hypothetical protein
MIHQLYHEAKNRSTDINEHLPVLMAYACESSHITELGVRSGESSLAFLFACLYAKGRRALRSYDIVPDWTAAANFAKARKDGADAQYIIGDSLKIEIEETDLLFIDTKHSFDQLRDELKRHAGKVRKWIILHDTYTYGLKTGEDDKGLLSAVIGFLIDNPQWKFHAYFTNNNGLTILKRTSL